jgi:hypothetical protein
LAKRLVVDPSTLPKWERAEREPAGRFFELVKLCLDGTKTEDADVRRAG